MLEGAMLLIAWGLGAVQGEEVAVVEVGLGSDLLEVVAAVLVGSSSGPPSQSPLVPPLQWWLGVVVLEPHLVAHQSPLPAATPPLALTLPWWPLVGEQALPLLSSLLPVGALVAGVPRAPCRPAGLAHLAKVGSAGRRWHTPAYNCSFMP
jgi:hypothetical protein